MLCERGRPNICVVNLPNIYHVKRDEEEEKFLVFKKNVE
jgi:hypothetical protein